MTGQEVVPAVWQKFATVCGLDGDPGRAREILQQTIMPNGSQAEVAAFVAVCSQYGLNPLRKEIYAFPSKGKVTPIVGVDGWLAIATRHPEHEAIEVVDERDASGALIACTASVWKKGSDRPTKATEYLAECLGNTEPWKRWPSRMLANKAMIQAIRRAYAVSGIMEPDEAERMREAEFVDVKRQATDDAIMTGAKQVVDSAPERLEVTEPKAETVPAGEMFPDGGDPEGVF